MNNLYNFANHTLQPNYTINTCPLLFLVQLHLPKHCSNRYCTLRHVNRFTSHTHLLGQCLHNTSAKYFAWDDVRTTIGQIFSSARYLINISAIVLSSSLPDTRITTGNGSFAVCKATNTLGKGFAERNTR